MPIYPSPSHPGSRDVRRARTFLPRAGGGTVTRNAPQIAVAAGPTVPGKSSLTVGGVDFPEVFVDIAWANNPLDALPTWTDVSADVLELSVNRGRSDELGRFETGEMTVRLRNTDGDYEPTNTAGAYYPNVLPMRPIRARARYHGVYYPLFRGFIEEYGPTVVGSANAEISLDCTDAFGWLANITSPNRYTTRRRRGSGSSTCSPRSAGTPPLLGSHDGEPVDRRGDRRTRRHAERGLRRSRTRPTVSSATCTSTAPVSSCSDRRQKIERAGTSRRHVRRRPRIVRAAVHGARAGVVGDLHARQPRDRVAARLGPVRGRRRNVDRHVRATVEVVRHDARDSRGRRPDRRAAGVAGKQPHERFTGMTVKPAAVPFSQTALWIATLNAEIGSVWTVKHRPVGSATTITLIPYVQGLAHRVGPGLQWGSTFQVAQPDPTTSWFTIGDPTLGKLDRRPPLLLGARTIGAHDDVVHIATVPRLRGRRGAAVVEVRQDRHRTSSTSTTAAKASSSTGRPAKRSPPRPTPRSRTRPFSTRTAPASRTGPVTSRSLRRGSMRSRRRCSAAAPASGRSRSASADRCGRSAKARCSARALR
jgi:hypothetical protein